MIRFITGTGTGVGKTVVAAAMARAEQIRGRDVAYLKPVQTGCAPGEPGDAAFVAAAAPGVPTFETLRFAEPLAPSVAAERAGTSIDVEGLAIAAIAHAVAADLLIVEGAGGLLVPMAGEQTMADLAGHMGAEVVVVCTPWLGTLNHTALTLEAARARNLDVSGIVISDWPAEPDIVEATNLAQLRRITPILGIVPHLDGLDIAQPGPYPDLELLPAP